MKKLFIIGNGLSAWCVANAFLEKDVSITLIGESEKIFGAQQLSPNGFNALEKLTQNINLKQIINEIVELRINTYKNGNLKNLKKFFFNEFNLNYHSISREVLLKLLIKNVKKKKKINQIHSNCIGIIDKNNNKLNVLLDNNENHLCDIIIGADGVKGVSRKYVCGESNIVTKKFFRGISKNTKEYLLLQKTLQLNFTKYGHFVSYPFMNKENKFLNHVFVPNINFQHTNKIYEKLNDISEFALINWKEVSFSFFDDQIQPAFKKNVLLFGNAGFTFEPHLAQVGNQIIEDSFYLKCLLDKNDAYNEIFDKFSRKRFKKKRELQSISNLIGKSFGLKDFKYLRDIVFANISDQLIYNFFNKIWND